MKSVVFAERESHRHSHTENEEWIYEVSRRASAPRSMSQRCEDLAPRAGVVHHAHKGYRYASEDVEREVSFHKLQVFIISH